MLKIIRRQILGMLPIRFRFALRYMASHKRFSLLLKPSTFTEKNMLRIAKDRRSLLQTCADKLAMQRYVEQKVGVGYLPKILQIAKSPENIRWKDLPERFVIKASHGSGFVSVVTQFTPLDKARVEALIKTCKNWLATDYGNYSREWAYVNLARNILIEEFIVSSCRDADGVPWDFKFFVFNGQCHLIQVDTGRFSNHRRNLYSKSWELMDCTYTYPPLKAPLKPPESLNKMVSLAERIGQGIDFVRVDIYAGLSGPLVGELTMTPGGGGERFSNLKLDQALGDKWKMAPFHD